MNEPAMIPPDDLSEETTRLARTVPAAEPRLQILAGDPAEDVSLPAGNLPSPGMTREPYQITEATMRPPETQAAVLDTIPVQVARLDQNELIIAANETRSWEDALLHSQSLSRMSSRLSRLGAWQADLPELSMIWSEETCLIHEVPADHKPAFEEVLDYCLPTSRHLMQSAFGACLTEGTPFDVELQIVTARKRHLWVRSMGEAVRNPEGTIFRIQGAIQDISERKHAELEIFRANRALKMLSAGNVLLVRAEYEQQLLDEICRVAVEVGGYRMAWVGFVQDDEQGSVKPMAHAGAEEGYLSVIKLSSSAGEPGGQGPGGRAIRSGRAVVCEDIGNTSILLNWRAAAAQRGYKGLVCLPLCEGGRAFGLLALYSAEVTPFDEGELKLLQELADALAFGITHLRSETEKRRLQAAVLKMATGVSAATGREFFEQLARNMVAALEARAGFVSQLLPGHPARGQTIAGVIDGQVVDNITYELEGAPCARLIAEDEVIVTRRVAETYPRCPRLRALGVQAYIGRRLVDSKGQVVGHLFALFAGPLSKIDFASSTLQIFAARAAGEIERRQADLQAREQAALLDAAADAITLKDMDDRLLFWNRGAEQIYGWTAAEAVGRKSHELLAIDAEAFDQAVVELLQTNYWHGECHHKTKDGRTVAMEVRWTLVRDKAGQPQSILAINTDITERKRLETQFLRMQRVESIGTLAGGVAHDLNNILAPILISLELLKGMVSHEDGLAVLNSLQCSAQRGADLVKQVLAFARGMEGQRLPVNPLHVLLDLIRVMKDTFPKSITVQFLPAPGLWTVTGDPTQLHQVFLNLCVNARDAMMPDGGTLTIRAENVTLDKTLAAMNPEIRSGSFVMVEVGDTGQGIPKNIRDRIFEPFFTTKKKGQGTGLGLSTTLAIVKSHGGFLDLSSKSGTGTQFHVYLPADPAGPIDEPAVADRPGLPRGHGELVLVVDDEEAIRKIMRATLELFGYRVMLAANGAEAVSLYTRHAGEIAVVVTDMAMPVMDGAATTAALKAINPRAKIIGSSGFASEGVVAKAMQAGVQIFIPKPCTTEIMLGKLAEVMQSCNPE